MGDTCICLELIYKTYLPNRRLKPIYTDRLDDGIMHADAPIAVVRESDATALVDGNMGLGLVVGPWCMKLAIEKAKKCGIGCVVVQNSTHFGIAGYVSVCRS